MSNNTNQDKIYQNINYDLYVRYCNKRRDTSVYNCKILAHELKFKKVKFKSTNMVKSNCNIEVIKIGFCYQLNFKSKLINFTFRDYKIERVFKNLYILIDLKLIALKTKIIFLNFIKPVTNKELFFIPKFNKNLFGITAIKKTNYNTDKIYNEVLILNGIKKYNSKEYKIMRLHEYYDFSNYFSFTVDQLTRMQLLKVLSDRAIIKNLVRITYRIPYQFKVKSYKKQVIPLYKKTLNLEYLKELYTRYRQQNLKAISNEIDNLIITKREGKSTNA